jgi:putative ABC transport system permease protein
VTWFELVRQDLRAAVRSVRRYPVAVAIAIISLAAGIGATAVTLTIRDVVFRNFPVLYREPAQLSQVQIGPADRPIRAAGSPVPVDLFTTWTATPGLQIAGSMSRGARTVRTGDRTETVAVREITPNMFGLLGVAPIVGTGFSESTNGVMLSYRAWQRLFDGRSDVAGQPLWIDGRPYTVTGAMPERFWLSDMSSPVWTPLDPRALAPDDAIETIVRRPAGLTAAGLDAKLRAGFDEYARRQPEGNRRFNLRVSGVEGTPMAKQLSFVVPYILAAAVLLTLLIACANVAVLMIAQWTARDREIAIRASIGASRWRIVRSLLMESTVIAAAGGALGVGVALVLRAVVARSSDAVFLDLSLDPGVLARVMLITLTAGLVTGLAPALYETRRLHANPLRALRGSDRVRQRMRHGLVVFEIAVTLALLVVTASMIDGYRRAHQADVGFDIQPLLTARVEKPDGVHSVDVLRVASRLPGVAAAAASTSVPFAARGETIRVSAAAEGSVSIPVERAEIRGPFFAALGVPIVAGRTFADGEAPAARAIVVNEALARRLFADRHALGATVWISSVPYDVVGVAADYAGNPFRVAADEPRVFVPLAGDAAPRELQVIVRAAGDPAPLVQLLRREVSQALPSTAVSSAETFTGIIRIGGHEIMVATAPLLPLISIGMLLTMAGIYGVLAFAVSRRARELAVRVAVGAAPRDLILVVARHTLRLVAPGAGIGLAATFGLSRLVRAGGGAGSIWDPTFQAFAIPVAAIVVIGLIATWLPARRAAGADPATLLRAD